MKNKERTFSEVVSRFLWPIKFRKFAYSKFSFFAFIRGINIVIHVLFLEYIVKYIELGNSADFYSTLKSYFVYIVSFEIINFVSRTQGWVNTEARGIYDVYNKYLRMYISLENNSIEKLGTGKLIGIIQNGARRWAEMLSEVIELGISLIVALIFSVYMVSRVSLNYAFVFFILLILFLYLSKLANDRMQAYRRERYEIGNTGLRYLVKIVMSKMDILQSNRINNELGYLYKNSEDETNMNVKMSVARTFLRRTSPFGISLILLLTFFSLGKGVFDGSIMVSTLVGLSGALIIMQKIVIEFVNFYADLTKKFVYIEKMWDLFDTTPEIKGYENGKTFAHKTGTIEIKNLTYGYTKNKPVFKDFNLKLGGEKITALVGNSGSGKSTLIKLIAGYIRADTGDIIVDSQKLKDVSLKSYYKDIGYLTQEPSVFDGTVYDNLTYAVDRELKPGELDEVIKLAKCEFIYDLPNGVETEIGERGIRLSGGQRQRLAIAKIFLKDPKIILLDEPTSALDSFSEEQITEAMHNLFKGRTIIVIAHRLQTVKHADDIILIENGEVKERGTHKELIKQKGIYKKMLDLQSGF